VSGEDKSIELYCRAWDASEEIVVRFLEVEEFQFVDLALGNVLDQVSEAPLENLHEFGAFPAYSKGSVQRTIDELKGRGAAGVRLWIIVCSYGLRGAVLARELRVYPVVSGPPGSPGT